jgi:hypothetical protein
MSHTNATSINRRHKVSACQYQIIKKQLAEAARYTHLGRKHSIESREKRSIALKGRPSPTKGTVAWNRGIPMTDNAKEKASAALKGKIAWNKGVPATPESNIKRIRTQRNIPKEQVLCPHCNKVGGKPAMIRHHFDNCKLRT